MRSRSRSRTRATTRRRPSCCACCAARAGSASAPCAPARGHVVRPLLEVSRAEVLAHLEAHGLTWREDPTNRDLRFARNRVRHELIPYLENALQPARARRRLARVGGPAGGRGATPGAGGRRSLVPAARAGGGRRAVPRVASVLRAMRRPRWPRLALRRALARRGRPARRERHPRRASARARARTRRRPAAACRCRADARRWSGSTVSCSRAGVRRRKPFATPLPVPGRVVLAGRPRRGRRGVRADRASRHPIMRSCRRPGRSGRADPAARRPHPLRSGREVSLKRYLLDRRVPADLRTGLPLVAEGSRVVWIPGLVSRRPRRGRPRLRAVATRKSGDTRLNPKPEMLFDADAIARRVAQMGAEIGSAYDGKEVCVVGIMKSCLVFMADLIRHIPMPTTCHFLRSTSVREEVAGSRADRHRLLGRDPLRGTQHPAAGGRRGHRASR